MPRSVGITISAVVAIIGSVFTLLGGVVMVLASTLLSKSSPAANVPTNLGPFAFFDSLMLFGFGGWGLATGIGLIALKRWARISTLVFAGILVFVSLPAAVLITVIPLPNNSNPNLPSNFMSIMRIGMVLFYFAFSALGGFWLYFFNKRAVKVQFQANQADMEFAAPKLSPGEAISAPSASQLARPLSITIIGWFLVVTSVLSPLGLLFNGAFLSGVKLPFYFLGFFIFGRSAYLILIVWMAAQMTAAVGLLKLKRWGLFATIGLQCLTAVNAALLIGIPSSRARFQQIMETMIASMSARMPQPVPFVFPVWLGLAISFPIIFVILWCLITKKQAFTSAAQELARQRCSSVEDPI